MKKKIVIIRIEEPEIVVEEAIKALEEYNYKILDSIVYYE